MYEPKCTDAIRASKTADVGLRAAVEIG